MRILSVLAIVIVASVAHGLVPSESEARFMYEQFKRKFNKATTNEDDEMRFAIFRHNLHRIQELQKDDMGSAEYGVTEFSDLTATEFAAKFANAHMKERFAKRADISAVNSLEAPDSFDWSTKGAVGPVLDQGSCGSCWAFSVIGNVEGQWFRKTGKLPVLSKQQLVDCSGVDSGCHGGYPPRTYKEIVRFGGLMSEKDYPYKAKDGKCVMDKKKFVSHINSSIVLPINEKTQAAYLATHGPLSSALNASPLQFYHSGVMHPSKWSCSPQGMNHAVLTVGYGVEGATPFWRIRNSWDTRFGEKGYFRIYRGDGTCGIDQVVSSAIIN